jgi:uncharacterized DUF497 family protein
MEFDYNPVKSMTNLVKHGISFKDAQQLWKDSGLRAIKVRTAGEPRWMAIGLIGDKHWSGVFTPRGEVIRIISVRRSRPNEIALYEI